MFWNKKKIETKKVTTRLGDFVYDGSNFWDCKYTLDGSDLDLSYFATQFDSEHVNRFELAIHKLKEIVPLALEVNKDDILSYKHTKEQMVLLGITVDPDENDEDFQLDFTFSNWPEGGLTVHIKENKILASHIDD